MKESFECRNCKSQLEDVFINLGNMPLWALGIADWTHTNSIDYIRN